MSLIETIATISLPPAAISLRVWRQARAAARWLGKHPLAAVAMAAVVVAGVEYRDADKSAALAGQRGAALTAIQDANARAIAQATAAKETRDAFNTKLAVDGDRTAADLRDNYHAAVMQLAAAQDRARSADLPSDADPAAGSDRPGESPGVSAEPESAAAAVTDPLAIGRDDALTCADNTARLQAVHDWAVALGQ